MTEHLQLFNGRLLKIGSGGGVYSPDGLPPLVPPVITKSSPLPTATDGSFYTTTFGATSGTAPYTWLVIAGSVPGISMNSGSGVYSGTPTAYGSYSITVQVTDAANQQAQATFSITVNPMALVISNTSLPVGSEGSSYGAQMAATGGVTPYTNWAITSGTLPAGITFSSSGAFGGVPTATTTGTALTIRVTDSAGTQSSVTLTLVVNAVSANLLMYSGATGVCNQNDWPIGNDYSYGGTFNYKNTTNLQSGHSYNHSMLTENAGWQQATNWMPEWNGGDNGLDISAYTYIMMDIWVPSGGDYGFDFLYTRSTGDDISPCTGITYLSDVPGGTSSFVGNAWNYQVKIPLALVGSLSSYNYYKFGMQQKNTNGPTLHDNVYFIAGNVGWVYRGNSTLEAGWAQSNTNATVNYAYNPQTISTHTYAANNPPNPASLFTGSISGTTLTTSNLSKGPILIGQTLLYNNSPSPLTIVSGSGSSWQISSNQGTVSSQQMISAWRQADVKIAALTVSASGGIWRVNYSGGYDLSPYDHFTFGVMPTKSNWSYQIQFYNTSGAAIGTAVTPTTNDCTDNYGISTQFFTVYILDTSRFGTAVDGQVIGGFSIKDTSGNSTNLMYLSQVGFYS